MNVLSNEARLRLSVLSVICISIITTASGGALALDFQGQASPWFILAKTDSVRTELGFRYIPSLVIELPVMRTNLIDVEISANAYGKVNWVWSVDDYDSDYAIDLYRFWGRFSGSQYELRGGLQKISFGSATVFRPLMWFDQIDVRDPLRITDGVYAMLFRYYFLSNVNIWLWGLYGNYEVKGWENYPTDSGDVEYGSRVQIPVFSGEYGVSFHHRDVSLGDLYLDVIPENRIGMDGKWDIGVGVWLEGVMVHMDMSSVPENYVQQIPQLQFEYQRYLTVGLDYTFNIGNGIYALAEHLLTDLSDEALGSAQERRHLSAVSLRYSVGNLDELSAIVYYDWDSEDLFRYAKWTRTYDRWMINLIGFWNPDIELYDNIGLSSTVLGRGLQIIIAYNH